MPCVISTCIGYAHYVFTHIYTIKTSIAHHATYFSWLLNVIQQNCSTKHMDHTSTLANTHTYIVSFIVKNSNKEYTTSTTCCLDIKSVKSICMLFVFSIRYCMF